MKKNKKAIVLCTALCIMAFGLQNSVKAAMSEQANELYTQAIKFENEERYEDALDLILKALNTSYNDIVLITKLGGLYAHLGELDKAAQVYSKAIQLNPEDAFLHISIGNIYEQQENTMKLLILITEQ